MKILIVATSRKPKKFTEELKAGQRYRIEYLELCEQLPASYMDYDAPGMHTHKLVRKLEEKIHVDFFWASQIARKVRREKFDVVLSMSERIGVPLAMMLDARVKHIVILLNAMAPKWLAAIKFLNLQSQWSHILTFSQAEADALMKELSIGPEKISKIPNCVDLNFFNPDGIEIDATLPPFIMSQGLSKRDYPTLIRAMRKLPHVTCQISAVSAWDKFQAGYDGMDIPANVQLKSVDHPFLIKNFTAQSQFVVLPLQSDTGMWCAGSTTVLQAQALGKPIVVSYLPGIAEYVEDGETGYVVPPNDPDAMADAIDRLWRDPELTARMGRNARAWIAENFDFQRYVDQLATLIHGSTETARVQAKSSILDIKTMPQVSRQRE